MVAPVTYAKTYLRPVSVEDAFARLTEGGAELVAGGTEVSRRPSREVVTLIDLSEVGLDYIVHDDSQTRVGAMTTLTDLLWNPSIREMGGGFVADMLRVVGSPLLRNIATIGGHVARGRLSDIVPVLLVLDARIALFDGEHSELALADYFDSGRYEQRHIVTELVIPSTSGIGSFRKFSRTAFDLAMLNCACAVEFAEGVVARAGVAIGETPWLARRLEGVEALLVGETLDGETITRASELAGEVVRVGTDLRASARYRRQLTNVAVSRSLAELVTSGESRP